MRFQSFITIAAIFLLAAAIGLSQTSAKAPAGFTSLFNGSDLSSWKIPAGDNGHWKVLDGVIDYDARSEAAKDKNLWTKKEYGDFVLRIDWRLKETPFLYENTRIILPDGSYKLDENGKEIVFSIPDSDSGILLRGGPQINIWCWPIGSGELWSVRRDKNAPPEVRAAAVPKTHADNNIGEWNTFEVTLKGDRVTVVLNGKTVIENAQIPGLAEKGPIGLQHHGRWDNGKWAAQPSLVQFRNIFVKEL